MGFKLKIMKNKFLFSFILFSIAFLGGCSNNIYQKYEYDQPTNPWINAFKDNVFFQCLKESYKGDSIFKMIEKKDAFNPYDGLSLEAIEMSRELAKNFVKNMPPPVMCENCESGQNYYMARSLHYYSSKELDNIAKKLYKKHLKIKRKYGL